MRYKNPLSEYDTEYEKKIAFIKDKNSGSYAYKSDGTKVKLSEVNFNTVEFIGGLWRFQDDFKYNIQLIRDREMILGKKLDYKEKTFFEYYEASTIKYNCYGPIFTKFDMVVAKYVTDMQTHWGYGNNVSEARAFLGIKLYDKYKDLIHSVACKNLRSKRKK